MEKISVDKVWLQNKLGQNKSLKKVIDRQMELIEEYRVESTIKDDIISELLMLLERMVPDEKKQKELS